MRRSPYAVSEKLAPAAELPKRATRASHGSAPLGSVTDAAQKSQEGGERAIQGVFRNQDTLRVHALPWLDTPQLGTEIPMVYPKRRAVESL